MIKNDKFKLEEFHFLIEDSEFTPVSEYLLSKEFTTASFDMVSNKYYGTVNDILKTQNEITNRFLNDNLIVIYVDVDEIIYHQDLRNYILNNLKDYITPSGIVLILNSNEKYLDPNEKILNQRNHCIFDNTWHSKTCILNKKYIWSLGRHNKRTNKIYKNVSFKYLSEEKTNIDKMVTKLLPSSKPYLEYILNTKLF